LENGIRIVNLDRNDLYPKTLIAESAELSGATNDRQRDISLSFRLRPGYYWACVWVGVGGPLTLRAYPKEVFRQILGALDTLDTDVRTSLNASLTYSSGGFPPLFPDGATVENRADVPALYLGVDTISG